MTLSSLRRLALAGMVALLVGCDSAGGGVTSPTPVPTPTSTPQSITIAGTSSLTNKNETSQLTATLQNSTGSTQDVTASATWATSSPDVASVSNGGLVTALANGTTNITATSQGKTNTFLITVAMKATPEATYEFSYLCYPVSGIDVTITEASGNIGMTVTSVLVEMYDSGGSLRVYKTLSASEIASQWGGSNRLDPGETRVVSYEGTYPAGTHNEDSTADVTVRITDDAGNVTTLKQKNIQDQDKC